MAVFLSGMGAGFIVGAWIVLFRSEGEAEVLVSNFLLTSIAFSLAAIAFKYIEQGK